MRIDWWTLGLQTINLLVLLAILGRFLFRPMARIVAERQAEAVRLIADAQAQRDRSQALVKDAEAQRAALDREREGLLDAARKDAESQRAALVAAASAEAAKQRAAAEEDIERLQGEEEARVGRRAHALATDIAGRLLEGPAAHLPLAAFLGGFEQALAALPEASRDAIGSGAPVALVSAHALGEEELAACHAAVARALGREVALAPEVDPALIAGLRLRDDSVSVDANLRADLERVQAALDAEDDG